MPNRKTSLIAKNGIYVALAFLFSYIEALFPLPIPFPGVKLGLANLVIIIILYRDGFFNALGISLVRNLLNALTFGSLFGLFYSLAGSILSLLAMWGLKSLYDYLGKRNKEKTSSPTDSLITVSMLGGIIHNGGQFLVAVLLVTLDSVIRYLPFLYFAGLIAGLLIGIVAKLVIRRIK